ncbi:MAG TPA: ubiquinol-cytochrome c reductase iron-sulfur subunit [Gammaproteobacteria bacterium]
MNRRGFLKLSLTGLSGLAAFLGSIPFVRSFLPSAKAKALGNPIEVDLSRLRPGEVGAYAYRGRTMLVLRRTDEMLAQLGAAEQRLLDPGIVPDPAYVHAPYRSIDPEYLVVEGFCTHLGCVPRLKDREEGRQAMGGWWPGGFICPCHRSGYDYAGRVIQGPAPTNLPIPPHRYVSPTRIVIGEPTEVS